jgi:activator of HSP90 ATPase
LTIHQEVSIAASPAAIYKILTDVRDFARMTGGRAATIASEAGGAFSMFDGHITGRHVELVPGKRIVQAWRAKDWPEGHYSITRFDLTPDGAVTKLTFDQSGHPDEHTDHLTSGWVKMYWEPMKAMLAD